MFHMESTWHSLPFDNHGEELKSINATNSSFYWLIDASTWFLKKEASNVAIYNYLFLSRMKFDIPFV